MCGLASDDSKRVLSGTALEIYRYLLTANKPVGIRETQRALNLSSPSIVTYHFDKLEEAGLVKQEKGMCQVNKVLLEHSIRVSHYIIPRYLFYTIFAVAILIIELTLLRPTIIHREYIFSIIAILIFSIIFLHETIKSRNRGDL